jgi:cytosine/adenosine deaminase-related metal-dependent hydrolase
MLIKNIDWLITIDKERRMIADGAIAISSGRIEAVGKSAQLESGWSGDVMDGKGLMAVPGLIDTSVATVQQLGRGLGDGCDIAKYRVQRCLAYESALDDETAAWATRACQLEMIRSGTTCFVDSGSRHPDTIAKVALESGLRAVVSRSCYDIYNTHMGPFPESFPRENTGEALRQAKDAVLRLRGIGSKMISAGIALPWLAATSAELCRGAAMTARELGVRLLIDTAPSHDDATATRLAYNCTDVDRLLEAEALQPTTILAHAGWTSPRDLRLIRDSGVHIACCPSMSYRLGTGAIAFGRYPELLEFGVNVSLGSGSAMGSNFVDIARQLYLFSGGNKSHRLDATVTPPEASLEMATIRGAAAIGLADEIGSLEPGKRADITLFQTRAADWVPVINPISNLTFSSRGGAHTVIVDGKALLSANVLQTLDEERVLRECQHRAEAVMKRSGLAMYSNSSWPLQL